MKSHIIDRTSPAGKGMPFVGKCRFCGAEGLTSGNMNDDCPGNTMSSDETLLHAIGSEDGYDHAQIEFTDRYAALGMKRPDPTTMCDGKCEGTGYVPVAQDETDPVFKSLWDEIEAREPADDGWHFVRCPDCDGTGKKGAV